MSENTSQTGFQVPEGTKRLSPLDMNKLAILKAHTVITFSDTPTARQD